MTSPQIFGRLLVLGGSSYVGGHLLARLAPGSYTATYAANPAPGCVHFDCAAMRLADADIGALADYDTALLLLGDTQPDSCVRDPERSHAVNVTGFEAVIDDLLAAGVRPVFVSSEFVFDGRRGNYVESDAADPILLYGRQKLAVERYLASRTDDYTVLRFAKVYGETPGDGTLFTNWLEPVMRGGRLKCAADQYFSPVFVEDVVDALLRAAAHRPAGVYHLAGPARMSRSACLEALVAAVGEYRPVDFEIEPCGINDFDFPEPRPLDVSMRIDKLAAAVDFHPRTVEETCRRLAAAEFSDGARRNAGGAP
jgi:dTDP-4-dehydrorhamnose reductase